MSRYIPPGGNETTLNVTVNDTRESAAAAEYSAGAETVEMRNLNRNPPLYRSLPQIEDTPTPIASQRAYYTDHTRRASGK